MAIASSSLLLVGLVVGIRRPEVEVGNCLPFRVVRSPTRSRFAVRRGVVRRQVGLLAYGVASSIGSLLVADALLGLDTTDPCQSISSSLRRFRWLLPVKDEAGGAVSTLAAVPMFSPVRRQVVSAVDRRFFRTR